MIGKRINYDYPPRVHTNDDLRYAEDIIIREGRIEDCLASEAFSNLGYIGQAVKILGTLDVLNDVVIFASINNVSSILYYKVVEKSIIPVIDNNSELVITLGDVVDSVYKINDSSEIEIVFTGLEKPYYLNIGTRDRIKLSVTQTEQNDILLFPNDDVVVNMTFDINNTGMLTAGVYFFTYRYLYKDGKYSTFSGFSEPIVLSEDSGIIINIDQSHKSSYDGIALYALHNGEVFKIYEQEIGELSFTYAYNTNGGTTTSLNDLTVEDATYSKVGTLGVVDNTLVLGDVTTNNYRNINLQPYVNDLVVDLNIDIKKTGVDFDMADNTYLRTFRPGEVYALYLKPIFIDGSKGKDYHIPCNEVSDFYSKFNTTVSHKESVNYPSNGGFPTGPVRNHKFPSTYDIYNALTRDFDPLVIDHDGVYGVDSYPIFSISINLTDIVPASIAPYIREWKLSYAQKTMANSRVVDYCQMVFSAKPIIDQLYKNDQNDYEELEVPDIVPSGGNFSTQSTKFVQRLEPNTDSSELGEYVRYSDWAGTAQVSPNHLRLQSAEMVTNKYVVSGSANVVLSNFRVCSPDYKYITAEEPIATTEPAVEGYEAKVYGDYVDYRVYDYTNPDKTTLSTTQVNVTSTEPLNDLEHVISGTTTASKNNVVGESCLTASWKISEDITWVVDDITYKIKHDDIGVWYKSSTDYDFTRVFNAGVTPAPITDKTGKDIITYDDVVDIPDFIATAQIIATGGHPYFWKDTPIVTSASVVNGVISTKLGLDGDTFLGTYTGFYSAPCTPMNLGNLSRVSPSNSTMGGYLVNSGIKVFRKTLAYSRLHLDSRTQSISTDTFKNIDSNSIEYFRSRDLRNSQVVTIDPSLSTLNTYEASEVHYDSIFYNDTVEYPFRIHSSEAISWRTFPALQIQDVDKAIGAIRAIVTYGDTVYLHFEYGLYATRDKVSLNSDEISVYVGTTDFLGVAPQEIMSKNTNIGLADKSVTLVTKLGYLFMSRDRKLYLINNGLHEISSYATRYLFRNNLLITDSDTIELGYDSVEERLLVTINTESKPLSTAELTDATVGDIVSVDGNMYKVIEDGRN